MRGVLALSASDLWRQRQKMTETHQSILPFRDPGFENYNVALRNLSVAFGNLSNSSSSLESIIGILCMLVMYEWKFGVSVHSLRMHINGVCSYVENHLRRKLELDGRNMDDDDGGAKTSEFTPFCAQMLLWVA